ncbi:hypothetical protein QYF61_025715 [Mycteria americana]|uniref:Uncharacterized protein n=1 Tax=Mycteria americana TaxID=33587 RepID=A0AAN7NFD3_MYCAM|nr:hypothetical protein QYF61_025715 [Mycteria americana]
MHQYVLVTTQLESSFAGSDAGVLVVTRLNMSHCPNELNKAASVVTDLDCAEDGIDLDAFYYHIKYRLKNCH